MKDHRVSYNHAPKKGKKRREKIIVPVLVHVLETEENDVNKVSRY